MPLVSGKSNKPLITHIPQSSPEALRRAYAAYRRMDPQERQALDSGLLAVVERVKCRAQRAGRAAPSFSPCQALELVAAMIEKGYL